MHRSLEKLREASIERIRSAPLARAVGTVRLVPEATLEEFGNATLFLTGSSTTSGSSRTKRRGK